MTLRRFYYTHLHLDKNEERPSLRRADLVALADRLGIWGEVATERLTRLAPSSVLTGFTATSPLACCYPVPDPEPGRISGLLDHPTQVLARMGSFPGHVEREVRAPDVVRRVVSVRSVVRG